MGVFGAATPKPHILYSNDKGLVDAICQKAGYMSRDDQRKCTGSTTVKYVDKRGAKRRTGIKTALKDSQRLVWHHFEGWERPRAT